MGAIGCPSSLPILTSLSSHTNKLISETCIISIARIQEKDDPENFVKSRYTSIDPAPAEKLDLSCDDLEEIMLDTKIHLYTRYKVKFIIDSLYRIHY